MNRNPIKFQIIQQAYQVLKKQPQKKIQQKNSCLQKSVILIRVLQGTTNLQQMKVIKQITVQPYQIQTFYTIKQ